MAELSDALNVSELAALGAVKHAEVLMEMAAESIIRRNHEQARQRIDEADTVVRRLHAATRYSYQWDEDDE